jgi:hypothetical protein
MNCGFKRGKCIMRFLSRFSNHLSLLPPSKQYTDVYIQFTFYSW